jgi:hypothetical protein
MLPQLAAKLTALIQRRQRLERRSAKRLFPTQLTPCHLIAAEGVEARDGWLHNLSVRGMGVLTDRAYPLGSRLKVQIVNASHTFCLAVELTVVRCRRTVSGEYFAGGQFDRVLNYDELLPFMM